MKIQNWRIQIRSGAKKRAALSEWLFSSLLRFLGDKSSFEFKNDCLYEKQTSGLWFKWL